MFLSNTNTISLYIFTQYTFSRISHRPLDAQKFDVSENYIYNRTNGIIWHVREKIKTRKYALYLVARSFSCAKISTLTV